jgi:Lon protease-like protein
MTFTEQFWGSFQGILNWSQLDELWQAMQTQSQAWYLYQPYQALPQAPLTPNELHHITR